MKASLRIIIYKNKFVVMLYLSMNGCSSNRSGSDGNRAEEKSLDLDYRRMCLYSLLNCCFAHFLGICTFDCGAVVRERQNILHVFTKLTNLMTNRISICRVKP